MRVVVGCSVVVSDGLVSEVSEVVLVDEVVVSSGDGIPMSVVDNGTLVVNVVDDSDGVMIIVVFSRDVSVWAGAEGVVVTTVVTGLLHSSDIEITV